LQQPEEPLPCELAYPKARLSRWSLPSEDRDVSWDTWWYPVLVPSATLAGGSTLAGEDGPQV